ncbi:MAG: polysaccharide biosynthesis/export family protein [Elainellaceae cyanobacterium]
MTRHLDLHDCLRTCLRTLGLCLAASPALLGGLTIEFARASELSVQSELLGSRERTLVQDQMLLSEHRSDGVIADPIEVESLEFDIDPIPNEYAGSCPPPSVNTYVLGVGDRLQIDVFDAPEYSGEFEVLADGSVRLPFAGGLQVRGVSIDQVTALISQRYLAILRRPIVSVQLLEARPISLALVGEVNSPGAYTITTEDVDGQPTVTKAIQLAEGITPFADIRNVQVQRIDPRSRQPCQIFTVDLFKLLREADLGQDVALQDGDRIIIPEATELDYDDISEISDANFSPGVMNVNVIGSVDFPGLVEVAPNAPLSEALIAAGGFDNEARRRKVELVRLNDNGTVSRRTIEVSLEDDINQETNPPLRPSDTVIVERSRFVRVTDAIGRVLSPVSGLFRLLGL